MVYIILGEGFEPVEAAAPADILRRGGVETVFAGIGGGVVTGAHGIKLACDIDIAELEPEKADMIVIPGGLGGVNSIKSCSTAMKKINEAYERGAALAAICAGPTVLYELGVLDGVSAVCYPGMEEQMPETRFMDNEHSHRDGRIITGRGPCSALEFGFALLEYLKGHEAARKLRADMACL